MNLYVALVSVTLLSEFGPTSRPFYKTLEKQNSILTCHTMDMVRINIGQPTVDALEKGILQMDVPEQY